MCTSYVHVICSCHMFKYVLLYVHIKCAYQVRISYVHILCSYPVLICAIITHHTTLSLLYINQWIRDHWHRQYNGRVRCCCGWYQGGSQPVTQGRIANRCDYRRLVTETEDVTQCRDANEDHGLGFEGVGDTGCDSQYASQINAPIPEDDPVCWEIQRFGYTENPVPVPTMNPTPTNATPRPSNSPIVTPPPTKSTAPTPPTVTSKPTVSFFEYVVICIVVCFPTY